MAITASEINLIYFTFLQGKDARSHVAMGNLALSNLSSNSFEAKVKSSYKFYYHALDTDKKNVYAANGLGIIFAEKKLLNVAKDVFSRVSSINTQN